MRRRTLPRVGRSAKLLTASAVVLAVGLIATTAIAHPGPEGAGADDGAPTAVAERGPDRDSTQPEDGTPLGRSGTGILGDVETEAIAEAIADSGEDSADPGGGEAAEAPVPSGSRSAFEMRSVSPDGRPTPSALLLEPATPRDLRLGTDAGCATGSERPTIDTVTPQLSAAPVLRHEREVVSFELGTVAEPAQAVWMSEWVSLGGLRSRYAVTVPDGVIAEGDAYAWRVRSSDGTRTSAWSRWCEFAVDVVPAAPGIRPATDRVETIYLEGEAPSGAIGREGRFVLGSAGPADIVAYEYRFSRPEGAATSVVAATADGTAVVAFRPDESGAVELSVIAIDAAGHRSPTSSYVFNVADQVYSGGAPHVPWGLLITNPYRDQCVTGPGRTAINSKRPALSAVGTHDGGGNLEMRFEVALAEDPGTPLWTGPWLTPAASESRFQFQVPDGVLSGAGSYAWRAEARQNGFSSGWSLPCEFDVDVVIPSAPSIAPVDDGVGAVYPEGIESGGVGETGRFRLAAADAGGVAFFTYSFTGTPTTKIPANPDGTAEIAFTPTRGGPSGLTVRAVDRAGNLSPSSLYSIDVAYW